MKSIDDCFTLKCALCTVHYYSLWHHCCIEKITFQKSGKGKTFMKRGGKLADVGIIIYIYGIGTLKESAQPFVGFSIMA